MEFHIFKSQHKTNVSLAVDEHVDYILNNIDYMYVEKARWHSSRIPKTDSDFI